MQYIRDREWGLKMVRERKQTLYQTKLQTNLLEERDSRQGLQPVRTDPGLQGWTSK